MFEHCLADPAAVGELAAHLRLLGDATRLRVLGLLESGEKNVSTLCGELDLAQPTVSHHLGLMRNAGLLVTRRAGKQVYYSLNHQHVIVDRHDGTLDLDLGEVRLSLGRANPPNARSA